MGRRDEGSKSGRGEGSGNGDEGWGGGMKGVEVGEGRGVEMGMRGGEGSGRWDSGGVEGKE